jgi:hypothetical protein
MEEKKEIVTGSAVKVAGLTVIPVVETRLNSRCFRTAVYLSGSKRAVGVIVISPEGEKTYNIDGEEVTLEELKR